VGTTTRNLFFNKFLARSFSEYKEFEFRLRIHVKARLGLRVLRIFFPIPKANVETGIFPS
jgi:hypothetical protein